MNFRRHATEQSPARGLRADGGKRRKPSRAGEGGVDPYERKGAI